MTEEELEYRHINPGMKQFGLISLTMMFIASLLIVGIVVVEQLAVLTGNNLMIQAKSIEPPAGARGR